MHVGTFTPEGTWQAADGTAAGARATRHHGHRGDAGGRVPRALRLGLRRRRPVRADAPVRRRRTTCARSSTARTRSASASSSTSSTTTSARTATTCASSRRTTSPTATRTTGARRSTSTARRAAGARVLRRERRLLDRRVPPRRPAARRDAADPRRLAPSTSLAAIARRAREAARRADASTSSARTSRRTRAWCGRRRTAATASTRCGTTTSTTRAMVALTGRREAYYTRLPRLAAGVRLGGEVRASCTRGSATRGRRSARGTPASICRRARFVHFLENHDQVANSAFGPAAAPADVARPLCAR